MDSFLNHMNPTNAQVSLDEEVVRFVRDHYEQLQEVPLELPSWPGQWVVSETRRSEVLSAEDTYIRSINVEGGFFVIYIKKGTA